MSFNNYSLANNSRDGEILSGIGFFEDRYMHSPNSMKSDITKAVGRAIQSDFLEHCNQLGVNPEEWVVGDVEFQVTSHTVSGLGYDTRHWASFSYKFYAGQFKPGIKVYKADSYGLKRLYDKDTTEK